MGYGWDELRYKELDEDKPETPDEKKARILELTKDIGPFHSDGIPLPPVNMGGCNDEKQPTP